MSYDGENDVNRFACNECKRRKLKCGRELPVCGSCKTAKRHCLYEQPKRSPLTRKHLTEVEEELSLVKQLLARQCPEIDLSVLIGKLRNGTRVTDIPELEEMENAKRRKIKVETPREEQFPYPQTPVMNIQSLLRRQEEEPLSESHKLLFQVPQLLPPTVNENYEDSRHKSTSASPLSVTYSNKCSWDERRAMIDRKFSVTDGMATTESNSYLGSTSSAALINLVGGGYFLSQGKPKHKGMSGQDSPGSTSSSASFIVPSRPKIEHYVNMYFETFHINYPIVHRPIFLAQMNEVVETPPGWKALLYIVAAIGSFMIASREEDDDDLTLLDCAKKELSIEDLERGSLTLVQTLALISNLLQKRDRPNSGYNYLGLSTRMAMALGLHKDFVEPGESLLDQEMRRRVWWCLYIFDCGSTITYGRPLGIACAGIDAKLPLNVSDTGFTAMTTSMPRQEDVPTDYTSVIVQSLFHVYSNSIYERIISDPYPSAEILLRWDHEYIDRWKRSIPRCFREDAIVPQRYKLAHNVLHWRCKSFRIILYRTFMLKRLFSAEQHPIDEFETRAGEICLQECTATIQSMHSFWEQKAQYNRMDAWYTLFFLVPAAVMPLVCLRNDPSSPEANNWRNDVMMSQRVIDKISKICPPAARISEFITGMSVGCLGQQPELNSTSFSPINPDDMSFPTVAVDESPISQLMQLHTMLWPSSFDIEQQF